MVMCFVPDSNHYSERGQCKFFRFPKDEVARKNWIKNVRQVLSLFLGYLFISTKYSRVKSMFTNDSVLC